MMLHTHLPVWGGLVVLINQPTDFIYREAVGYITYIEDSLGETTNDRDNRCVNTVWQKQVQVHKVHK